MEDMSEETLQDACDELWNCEDADEVYERLKLLRGKVLEAPPDSYDPSEAFLAVQGAALRFLPAQNNNNNNQDDKQQPNASERPPLPNNNTDESSKQNSPSFEVIDQTTKTTHPSESDNVIVNDDDNENTTTSLNWSITEAALYVTVDLACLCIGPAWRSQIVRRQQLMAMRGGGNDDDHSLTSTQSTWAPPSVVLQQAESNRSFSPMTAATGTANSVSGGEGATAAAAAVDNTSYPTIPEVLPAAMLRFAASTLSFFPDLGHIMAIESARERQLWDLRRKNIASGQRQLVMGLCCGPHPRETAEEEHESSMFTRAGHRGMLQKQHLLASGTIRWTIPGANELVGNMLQFWLRFAYPLDRIPKRLASNRSNDNNNSNMIQGEQEEEKFKIDWWYTLGVTRAATDLVSTGWRPLPKTNVGPIVVRYLLEIAQSGIALLDPTSTTVGLAPVVEVGVKEELIAALSSSAESISALASLGSRGLIPHESQRLTTRTVCHLHVVSGLMKASLIGVFPVGANQKRNHSLPSSAPEHETFLFQIESCFADTADFLWMLLGTKSSSSNSITALIDTFDAANPSSEKCFLFSTSGWDTRRKLVCMEAGTALRMTFAALWERHPGEFSTSHLRVHMGKGLTAIRSLVVSVHAKVHEIFETGETTNTAACDLLSLALDTVVALGHCVDRQLTGDWDSTSIINWEQILQTIVEAYTPWDDYSTPEFNNASASGLKSIIEQAHLERQSLMLRVGAFLDRCIRIHGSPFHSVVEYENQRAFYLFILRTVTPGIDPVDAELLGLTAIRAWVKFSFFPFRCTGWAEACVAILSEAFAVYTNLEYVHSPQVRAEALRALTLDSSKSDQSMLSMSRDVGDIHKKMTPCLITILHSVLSESTLTSLEDAPGRVSSLPRGLRRGILSDHDATGEVIPENVFLLESYAVKLVGKLVRETSIDARNRTMLIDLLRVTALDTRWPGIGRFVQATTETKYVSDRFHGAVRLSAVVELGHCFSIPFGNFPLLHGIIPQIVEALHAIITEYSNFEDQFDEADSRERASLLFAALTPLCRVRLCSDAKTLCLLPGPKLERFIPDFLSRMLSPPGQDRDRILFAPLVEVSGASRLHDSVTKPQNSSKKTLISLVPVMSAMILAFVSAEQHREIARRDTFELIQSISTICLHSLSSFVLSGFPLYNHEKFNDVVEAASVKPNAEDDGVCEERARALTVLSESAFARLANDMHSTEHRVPNDSSAIATAEMVVHQLRSACESPLIPYLISHSRALIAIVPSVAEGGPFEADGEPWAETSFEHTVRILRRELRATDLGGTAEVAVLDVQIFGSLLAILHEILSEVKHDIPQPFLLEALGVCKEIIRKTSGVASHTLSMAIRCLTTIIDRLHTENIEILCARYEGEESKRDDTNIPVPSLAMTHEFANQLEHELLVYRNFFSKCTEAESGADDGNDPLYPHDNLALEVERIEKFEVEKDMISNLPLKGSWLCGRSVLLTFRVGSSTSRYRGWVEIIVRSATFRKRVMVRLLSQFSVRNPDLPSMLWATETDPTQMEDPAASSLDQGTENILENYNALIGRFDSLVALTNPDDNDSQFSMSVSNRSAMSASNRSIKPPRQNIPVGQAIPTSSVLTMDGRVLDPENVSVASDQNAVMSANVEKESRSDFVLAELSIKTWLMDVLEDRHSLSDVFAALTRLNISGGFDSSDDKEEKEAGPSDKTGMMIPMRRLRGGPKFDRAVAMLDRIIPMNTHKIALLYAGPKRIGSNAHDLESSLLSTTHGSPTYHEFAKGLGEMVPTKQLRYFSAGLDVSKYESDGCYTRIWVGNHGLNIPSAKSVVVYHAVHLMPQGLNNRKRHVGNDNVLIVFVDKDSPLADDINITAHELKDSVVSGHFGFVTIYVLVLPESGLARVSVRLKHDLPEALRQELLLFVGDDIFAMHVAPTFVRSLAIRADLACRSVLDSLPPPCNCSERYQILREMERHFVK